MRTTFPINSEVELTVDTVDGKWIASLDTTPAQHLLTENDLHRLYMASAQALRIRHNAQLEGVAA